MNFLLSDQQREIQDSIAGFLREACGTEVLHREIDSDGWNSRELWQGLAELGVTAIAVPEEHGGLGLEMIDLAVVAETLGYAATPGPFLGHSLAALAIAQSGSEAQKAAWLPRLASGEIIATVALGEAGEQWQPEQWQLPGGAALSGEKRFVPFASAAGLIVVGVQGGTLALVDAKAGGLSFTAADAADRTRRLEHVQFDSAAAEVLGDATSANRLRDAALVLLAADAFGGAARCVDMAMEYAKIREQFGQPIGKFQGLKHQLVNTAVDVEPSRGLYWFAAHAYDHVKDQAERSAALAKAHVTDVFLQAARNTVEAHGGIGYTWECDVQIFVKRAMFDYAFAGAPDVHRARSAELAGW